MTLFGPNRQQIESKRIDGTSSGELSATVPRDGTYYLRVNGIEQTTGSYALTLTEADSTA
ncbi:hypothetical protein C2R22_01040 [Salinigranum rubrum]|uniref:Peptidase C-terminal archaeal/bacterial domain-containing protein n=1 Tax=Salinigranum rubrum TaxID=755307 RepID=A0A2I8VEW6_9EURY|nr:hypothetical protein C2R22_01040 [Salinigranum rubrum]